MLPDRLTEPIRVGLSGWLTSHTPTPLLRSAVYRRLPTITPPEAVIETERAMDGAAGFETSTTCMSPDSGNI
jgi:hypothetical protein